MPYTKFVEGLKQGFKHTIDTHAIWAHFDFVIKQNVELAQKVKELEQEVVLLSGAISDAGIML